MASDKIKVAVRVRPFNRRELEMGTQCVVEMEGGQTVLHHPATIEKLERKQPKTFAFDHCFYSTDSGSSEFASQETVFDCLGTDILDNAFQGYNACIFAYGQTGSGKSYTMMGSQENKGIIPRLCDTLFDRIAKHQSSELSYKVEVSYMEIYNEKVHDLLDPKPNKQSLKVREHAVFGPYVDGLSQLAVTSFQDIDMLMAEGNKSRTVAATNMNSESSRSHAVFSVVLTQTLTDTASGVSGEKVSRMSLVDLAGSERAVKTGAAGDRLKEGSNINKSLTTLGLVISKLADQSSGKTKDKFVPYRDSVLTWLLKDNLGGNSKTVMVAAISPASDNYEETLSTLRYADRAKRIVNHAVVNEDPNARIIRELRQEVEALKEMLKHATATTPLGSQIMSHDLHEKLTESEKLMREMSTPWEEKLIKTERLHQERQEALENMGISVQASGIKVEKNKYYLVNLNADPSLNELLVYYLKERTLVGAKTTQDIQLSGLGIQPEHCVLTIEDGQKLYMTPVANARSFINGAPVLDKTLLNHGDRILWGHHHFFRVNCPKSTVSSCSEPQTPAQTIDYDFAREELMLNELSNDPIQTAIARIEKQHEEDKQVALEKQRQEYEKQFQQLRSILSPSTPYSPYVSFDSFRTGKITPCTPTTQMRVEKWAQDRDEMFRRSLVALKADIVKANVLVKEANFLAEEMDRQTRFSVTLQIPPANLSPNRKRGAFVSEPAILVKRQGVGSQVWSMEKLENKLIDMRDMYGESKERGIPPVVDENPAKVVDPFYETQENHNLIGVANVFLEALFRDVTLDYQTPIISQQGEVAGRLQVELSRVSGSFPQDRMCEAASDSSGGSSGVEDEIPTNSQVTVRVTIKQASGLPPSLSNFVFCQYNFWNHPDSIAVSPVLNPDQTQLAGRRDSMTFKFNHTKDFVVPMTEEFIEHCAEGALSIEVWGHRSAGFTSAKPGWEVEQQQLAKARSLADRWSELKRKLELWVEILELNDAGEYCGVEVVPRNDILTGGVYQLRQGQQRRVRVRVVPVQGSGTLPIICQAVTSITVGSVSVRSRLQKALDSYQEEDLSVLRTKWSDALMRRRQYLDNQIQGLINKQGKSESDLEREQSLVEQWVNLTEERNAVLVPAAGSGIPGAPADWTPPPGMEPHIPVLFLDLNADDLSISQWADGEEAPTAGLNSILPKEHGNKFYSLQLIRQCEGADVSAVGAWDSSVHDSQHLNKVTDSNERVYLILKTTVKLSHPAPMCLVLRKRLCLNIYKRQSITDRIRRKIVRADYLTSTGVTYEVVSNIPKASEELEDRESLAQIAASGEDSSLSDGESYIEKYTKGVSAVEGILTLDRLRQSVAVKELLQHKGQPLMRKTASVPNISQLLKYDSSLDNISSVGGVCRSESVSDLNREARVAPSRKSCPPNPEITPTKPFGIARPTFLNLNLNLNSLRLQPGGSKPSPSTKLGLRMTTLHEEHHPNALSHSLSGEHLLEVEEEEEPGEPVATSGNIGSAYANTPGKSVGSRNVLQFSEFETYQVECDRIKHQTRSILPSSRTLDSLAEYQSNKGTPSTTSSGYGSQCVSSSNLTNEDCLSLRSMSVDETPDIVDAVKPVDIKPSPLPPTENKPSSIKSVEIKPLLHDTAISENVQVPPEPPDIIEQPDKESSILVEEDTGEGKVKVMAGSDMTTITCMGEENGTKEITSTFVSEDTNVKTGRDEPTLSVQSGDSEPTVVTTGLQPGKVVRRKKTSSRQNNTQNRASFPLAKGASQRLEHRLAEINGDVHSSDERVLTEDESEHPVKETPIPDWVCLGESIQIRPYNTTGVIAYIGPTSFASGTWVGVELDAPTGKNDGVVQGVRYFDAKPKHGIFVRADKLIQDRRGRAMRGHDTIRRTSSKGEGLSTLQRSRSRGEGMSSMGRSTGRITK